MKQPLIISNSYSNQRTKISFSQLFLDITLLENNNNIKWTWIKDDELLPPYSFHTPNTFILDSDYELGSSSPLINNSIICNTPHWIKTVNKQLSILSTWHSSLWTSKPPLFQDISSLILSNKFLEINDKISYKSLLSFKIKLLIEQLPTREKLHSRYPLLYPDNLCPRCKLHKETFNHIFSCPNNNSHLSIFNQKIKKFILSLIQESKNLTDKNLSILSINNLTIDGPLLLSWCKGTTTFDSKLSIEHKAKLIAKSIKIIYKYIWIPRSSTANTSPNSGIKWKKQPPNNTSNQSKTKQPPPIFDQVLNSFLLNNSTNFNVNLTNQIIQSIITFNSNTV
jgi:hypothetical protein